ncbi:F0F1 ATP synthase subunit epsilon [Natronoglycomyces albus]|uniref:ATP synthase epsilon chain n=1 Tax=Natronoglycomyces albus TaxID=2811108 RepID=A0A895XHZ2_9ACTN|nr:F0F1 ATP synthase subunit epsilon [Natronoglycomyces albus]QSB04954.1 F0F1 ATP synthase subunit epsilon [Natronoglycomyces albus]
MANLLNVELVAVEEKVWSGQATSVYARTTEGELGVLPGHIPMLGELACPGDVRINTEDGQTLTYKVNGGFLSVTTEGVTVLAETAEVYDGATAAA